MSGLSELDAGRCMLVDSPGAAGTHWLQTFSSVVIMASTRPLDHSRYTAVPLGMGLAAIPTSTPDAGGVEARDVERGAPGPVPTADCGSSMATASRFWRAG